MEDIIMLWVNIMKLAFEISLGTIKNESVKAKYGEILVTIAAQIVNIYGLNAVGEKAAEIRTI